MSSLLNKFEPYVSLLSGLAIYLLKGPPCKSWSLKTFLLVYVIRHTVFLPTSDLEKTRKDVIKLSNTNVENSKLQKVTIPSKFRQQAYEVVKKYLKKVYGDDQWYDEDSHWTNAKPLEAEWLIPNHLTLSSKSNAIFYIHGGGYIVGHFATYRPKLEKIAHGSDSCVFGAIYRLAPDYSAPCQLEDVLAQILYLTSPVDEQNPHESGFGMSFDQIVVSGDSAGGGLSSAFIHFLRDNQMENFAGAVLYSPWVDVTSSHPSNVDNALTDYLPQFTPINPSMGCTLEGNDTEYNFAYYGSSERIRKAMLERGHSYAPLKYINSPIVSPLCDNKFSDLPPVFLISGEVELLRDESCLYHEMINSSYTEQEMKESKIPPSTLHLYEEMVHIFPMFDPELDASKASFIRASNFVRQCFAVKSESFEEIRSQYPINTDLQVEDSKPSEHKWSNVFFSNLNHQLIPFTLNYPRNGIQSWGKN